MGVAHEILTTDPFKVFAPTEHSERARHEVIASAIEIVGELEGGTVRSDLESLGIAKLHQVFPPERVPELRSELARRMGTRLFQWAAETARERLGFRDEFYLDEKIYFRINFPFEVASRARPAPAPEVSLRARARQWLQLLRDRRGLGDRVRNALEGHGFGPTLDLPSYNKGRPQATWAHGPHIDTWYGHAYDSINFWWSIAGVDRENSMVLYPDSHKRRFPFDPRNMYLAEGVRTPRPHELDLADGELAIFDAELLHSTRLNTSDETRFVVTLRVNGELPSFSEETTHAIYDIWHRASDVEQGRIQPERMGRRVPDRSYEPWRGTPAHRVRYETRFKARTRIELGPVDQFDDFNVLEFPNTELLLVRTDAGFHCTASRCPHVGLALADGHLVEGQLQCPGHGVRFGVESGKSSCPSLSLRVYPLEETNGQLALVP